MITTQRTITYKSKQKSIPVLIKKKGKLNVKTTVDQAPMYY